MLPSVPLCSPVITLLVNNINLFCPTLSRNEKWCLYVNFKQRKEQLGPDKHATPPEKPDLHPCKTMLCIWWEMEGIIHYELLERNLTITTEHYSQQLHHLEEAIQQKRPGR
jgi:hypothetical protein